MKADQGSARFFWLITGQLIIVAGLCVAFGFEAWKVLALSAAFLGFSIWFGLDLFSPFESAMSRIRADLRQETETLKREREELAVIMENIQDAIVAIDTNGRYLFFNPRFALLFGMHGGLGKNFTLGETFRSPELLAAFRTSLEQGSVQKENLLLPMHQDESSRYFAMSVTPLKRQGSVYGAVGIFHDVTDLKLTERMRIDFVANVSHELRTPLTTIKGYSETLLGDAKLGKFGESEKFLERICENSSRLQALIEDLLDLSSLESGEELKRSEVSTREVTARALRQTQAKSAAKGHRIDIAFDTEHVSGDSRRIEQVLVNLIDNAIKYTPYAGVILIRWSKTGQNTSLSITDNGPGIPAEVQPRLFERFYRVDPARSRDIEGTGLGLSIVKHIMQKHGGAVSVRSQPGKGSEFLCTFPEA